jgi:hypothetical protein|tara:strand:- start:1265 stop:1633 length:369 start_codon:yes stop_codon:yes gene_type:complete
MSKEVKQFTTAKMDPAEIFGNACLKARYAVDEFTAKHGEPMYCGFANISIHPARGPFVTWCKKMEIGSTGYGGGYRISYYDFMNGHQYNHTQSLDIKEVAMNAVSSYFKSLGITAYAESRAD